MSSRTVIDKLSPLLALGGIALLGLGALADLFGIGAPGFGGRQLLLGAAGIAALVASSRAARAGIAQRWAAMPGTSGALCIAMGCWFGLMIGFGEVVHQTLRHRVLHVVLAKPMTMLWAPPALYCVAFTALAVALATVRAVLPRLLTFPVLVFLWVVLGVWSQLLLHPALHWLAVWALAVGIAYPTARLATIYGAAFRWIMVRSLPVLLGALAVDAAVVHLVQADAENSMLVSLPKARAQAPNVVLVTLDTVRADHLDLHGYPRETMPTLTELGRNGVVFDAAMTTSPWTLPSHVTLFTGRYHHKTSADWLTPLDQAHPTLAEALSDDGYETAAFVGNLNYLAAAHGVDRGFSRYEDFALSLPVIAFSTVLGEYFTSNRGVNFVRLIRNNATHVSDRFLMWLDNRVSGEGDLERPFFAFLNYFDAHGLYVTEEPFQSKFGPVTPLLRKWYTRQEFSPAEMQGFIDAYDGCISFVDHHFRRVVEGLRERGLLDNTLLIVTADHGELFGEHGLKDHSNSLYRPLLHAPLVIHFPDRLSAGLRVPDFVSIRDVPATILELAGVGEHALPGHSLSRFWAGGDDSTTPRPGSPVLAEVSAGINRPAREPVSRGDMKALFEDGVQLIVNGDGKLELYDHEKDPEQLVNLANTPEGAKRAAAMREKIRGLTGR